MIDQNDESLWAPDEIFGERLHACFNCESYENGFCKKSGVETLRQAKFEATVCPADKWHFEEK